MTITDIKKLGRVVETSKVDNKLVTETYTYDKSEIDMDLIRSQRDSLVARKVELETEIAEKELLITPR